MKEQKYLRITPDKDYYSSDELMRLRRGRIRDRRLRKGSNICGQILRIASADNMIRLEPDELDAAI